MNQKIEFLTSNKEIKAYLKEIEIRNCKRIAIDLEGDQGTVNYKNSISIIQIWDGEKAFIIDVLALDKNDALIEFLTSKKFTKVMFAASNDLFMTQNVLNCTIENLRDIAIAQKILNQQVNLAKHIGIEKEEKDHLQRANWVKRPIEAHLIEYAINDVLELLKMEDALIHELYNKQQFNVYTNTCEDLSKQNFRMDPLYVYSRRIGTYKHMSPKRKQLLRTIWITRELIGMKIDRPVGLIFSKKLMPFWVRKEMDIKAEILQLVNKKLRNDSKFTYDDISKLWDQAYELAEKASY